MKILSAKFTGYYIMASSLFFGVICQQKEGIAVVLIGLLFGFLVLKKKMVARRIVMGLSSFAALISLLVLFVGLTLGTEGINYSLGSLFQVSNPSLPAHILLSMVFACWFGIPLYILSNGNVKKEFESTSPSTTNSPFSDNVVYFSHIEKEAVFR